MRVDGDRLIMEDGASYYAYNGIVGLGRVAWGSWAVFEGYEGNLGEVRVLEGGAGVEVRQMPVAHMRELARYMVEEWQKVEAIAGTEGAVGLDIDA